VYLGFSVFIVGWIFQTVIFIAQLPYSSDYYYSKTNRWAWVVPGVIRDRPVTVQQAGLQLWGDLQLKTCAAGGG